jgi:hypothetical protein
MARYIGGSVAVAAVAMIFNAVTNDHKDAGESAGAALAAGFSSAALTMAIWCAAGVALVVVMGRRHRMRSRAVDRAAGAAATFHTIPTEPVSAR